MSRRPTGKIERSARGADLVIRRTFRASVEDVWESVTSSESTARWIGPWEREPSRDGVVRLQMAYEEGAPICDVQIERCEPPRRLAVRMKDDHGDWRIELTLHGRGAETELVFTQHLDDPKLAGSTGPGWEYYLDRVMAARAGESMPNFADYYPSQRSYYESQAGTSND